METNTEESESHSRIVKKRIIAYVMDIEDMRMYPIIDTGFGERNAIELPPTRSPAAACVVVPGGGDVMELEVFDDGRPTWVMRIVRGQP